MITISALVLNWNDYHSSYKCLKSLENIELNDNTLLNVIFIDNNSEDKSGLKIKNDFKNITYIQTGDNLGYAGGNNVGIKEALKEKSDFIWLINNDVRVDKSTLKILLETHTEMDNNIGFIGPKVLSEDSEKIMFVQAKIDDEGNTFLSHYLTDSKTIKLPKIIETDYVNGASIFFSSSLVNEIGLMDEEYFLYYEESDWCMRAKKMGYKNYTITNAYVYHQLEKQRPLMLYYLTRNRRKFSELYAENFSIYKYSFTQLFVSMRFFLRFIKNRKMEYFLKSKYIFIGLLHGILNRYGKY